VLARQAQSPARALDDLRSGVDQAVVEAPAGCVRGVVEPRKPLHDV
jgi:hypothetical protein